MEKSGQFKVVKGKKRNTYTYLHSFAVIITNKPVFIDISDGTGYSFYDKPQYL